MSLSKTQTHATPAMSKVMSSCAAACCKATRQGGEWAWRCCSAGESPRGSGHAMDHPIWTDPIWPVQNLAGYPFRPGRPISWSGCWRVWLWVRSGKDEPR